ncbi:MAG: hypothetical protein ABR920_07010 [Terriglobales bacterium]
MPEATVYKDTDVLTREDNISGAAQIFDWPNVVQESKSRRSQRVSEHPLRA